MDWWYWWWINNWREERESVTDGQDETAAMKVRAILDSVLPCFSGSSAMEPTKVMKKGMGNGWEKEGEATKHYSWGRRIVAMSCALFEFAGLKKRKKKTKKGEREDGWYVMCMGHAFQVGSGWGASGPRTEAKAQPSVRERKGLKRREGGNRPA